MSPTDELVDVIDAAGQTIGVVPRSEMRAKRLPHRCVYVLVFNTLGELFVHLRTPSKDVYPSHWDVCIGGVLRAGESFLDGARRELREELGIDAVPIEMFDFHYSDDQTFAHGMAFRLQHSGPFDLQADEIMYGEFAHPAEVLKRIQTEPFCPDGVHVFEKFLGTLPP